MPAFAAAIVCVNIGAGPGTTGLDEYGRQAGVTWTASAALARTIHTHEVRTCASRNEILGRLLAGVPVEREWIADKALLIRPKPPLFCATLSGGATSTELTSLRSFPPLAQFEFGVDFPITEAYQGNPIDACGSVDELLAIQLKDTGLRYKKVDARTYSISQSDLLLSKSKFGQAVSDTACVRIETGLATRTLPELVRQLGTALPANDYGVVGGTGRHLDTTTTLPLRACGTPIQLLEKLMPSRFTVTTVAGRNDLFPGVRWYHNVIGTMCSDSWAAGVWDRYRWGRWSRRKLRDISITVTHPFWAPDSPDNGQGHPSAVLIVDFKPPCESGSLGIIDAALWTNVREQSESRGQIAAEGASVQGPAAFTGEADHDRGHPDDGRRVTRSPFGGSALEAGQQPLGRNSAPQGARASPMMIDVPRHEPRPPTPLRGPLTAPSPIIPIDVAPQFPEPPCVCKVRSGPPYPAGWSDINTCYGGATTASLGYHCVRQFFGDGGYE